MKFTGLEFLLNDGQIIRLSADNISEKSLYISKEKIEKITLIWKNKYKFAIIRQKDFKEWYFAFVNSIDSKGQNKVTAVEAGFKNVEGELIRFQMLTHCGSLQRL